MVARVYSWADAGAPALSGSLYAADILGKILDACLVDGYGSKPAAGWLRPAARNAYQCAYQNAANDCTVLFYSGPYSSAVVYLMDTWTTTNFTNLLGGVNVASANYAPTTLSSTAPHRLFLPPAQNSSYLSRVRWCVAADENSFALFIWSGTGFNNIYGDGTPVALYVGRYANAAGLTGPAANMAAGGQWTTGSPATNEYFRGGYTCLRHPVTGLTTGKPSLTLLPWAGPSTWKGYSSTFADTDVDVSDSPMFDFAACRVYASGIGIVGRARGVVVDPHYFERSIVQSLRSLGLPNATTSLAVPVQAADGHYYAACGVAQGQFFLTDNPAFW